MTNITQNSNGDLLAVTIALLQERVERILVQSNTNAKDIEQVRAAFAESLLASKDEQRDKEILAEGRYHTLKTYSVITWSFLSLIIAGLVGIALKVLGG